MNSAIELHDSEVTSVLREGSALRLVLDPAYIHRSAGRPGVDAGEGFLQTASIAFSGVQSVELDGECRGSVSDGSIVVSGRVFANVVPVPLREVGEVSAQVHFASGGVLKVRANGVACSVSGSARFVEANEG